MLEEAKKEIVSALSKVAKMPPHDVNSLLEVPKTTDLGDFAFPCFKFAAQFKASPQNIAQDLTKKLPKLVSVKKVQAVGPYINFFLNEANLSADLLAEIYSKKAKFGSSEHGKGKKIIVEFSGLNPNKPGHIGNARNTCLGDSLARILEFSGHDVVRMDIINDLGLPTAALFWSIKNRKEELPSRKKFPKEDHWQGAIYVDIRNRMDNNDEILEKIHKLLHEIEVGKNPKLIKEQRDIIEACVEAQYQTWKRLGALHDIRIHESDIVYSGLFDVGIGLLKRSGKLVKETSGENKGCYVVKLSQYPEFRGMLKPDKILIRADGTATYTGKDVIFQLWKFGLLPDKLLYKQVDKGLYATWHTGKAMKGKWNNAAFAIHVVGAEQKYVMQVNYHALQALGYMKEFKNSYHLAYGLVGFGGDSKISSREGASGLMADKILDEAVERAYNEVEKRNPKLNEKKKRDLAEKIGVSAVRYYLIKFSPELFIQFDWDKVLSFEGDAGPYLQYALVRARKILKKVGKKPSTKVDFNLFKVQQEKDLIKKLASFSEVVQKAVQDYSPHCIAEYAWELANTFSSFYEKASVLKAESKKLQEARLLLVVSFAQVLSNALNILGIEEVDVM